MKRTLNLAAVLQIVQKIPEMIVLVYIYQLAKFGNLMSCGSRNIIKMHPVSCAGTHDVTDLVNHGMATYKNGNLSFILSQVSISMPTTKIKQEFLLELLLNKEFYIFSGQEFCYVCGLRYLANIRILLIE